MVESQGLQVVSWDLEGEVQEVKFKTWIAVRRQAPEPWKRFLVAHAVGHHLLHAGNQLAFRRLMIGGDTKQERQADEFAWYLLTDELGLARVASGPGASGKVACNFGIPEEIAFRFLLAG